MSVLRILREALESAPHDVEMNLQDALAEAERLADEFSEVRPQSYIVPIEKFVGLPMMGEASIHTSMRYQR
jgi:hypothetical protein